MNLSIQQLETSSTSDAVAATEPIRYRLLRVRGKSKDHFFICIEFRSERVCRRLLTNDVDAASRTFCQIARGKVTPCSLADVLQDMF